MTTAPGERPPVNPHALVTPREEHLQRVRGHELAQLRWHWEDAYKFGWSDGKYWAVAAHDGTLLTAETAFELSELVICNYSERPDRGPGRQ